MIKKRGGDECKELKKTNQLSLRGTVLLEEVIAALVVDKFPAFSETRKFITVFTGASGKPKSSPHPHVRFM
jgi:hypothetical protein